MCIHDNKISSLYVDSGEILKPNLVLKQSVIAVAMSLAYMQGAQAQEAMSTDAVPVAQKVFVTGSNIKRSEKEGSSPVEVITRQAIEATGATTVAELLHSIPAFGSGSTVDIVDGGFSRGAATASLRGLGSSSTLVLLNGRRMTASAYADPNIGKSAVYDLNSIPISAVERVEIFKDGASAVYGSDAIAGVINFITKTDYQGASLSASYSGNDKNEFNRKNVNGAWGKGDLATDKYNFLVSFDLAKRGSTLIKDVTAIESGMYADINGRLNPLSSSLTDSPFFYREQTPNAKNFANSFALGASVINKVNCPASQQITGSIAANNLVATDALVGRTFCNINLNDFAEAQSAGKDANLLSKATFQLTPDITSFTEFGYSRSDRTYLGAPSAFRSTASTTVFTLAGAPTQFQVILPVGHPDNPFPTSRAAVGYRFVNNPGGSDNLNTGYRLVTGLKGTSGSWDWETAALYNRSERTEHYFNLLYKPTLNRIMTENRTLAATAADPTATRTVENHGYASVAQIDAKASTSVGKLGGGDIGLAFGGELRQEKIGLTPDAETQAGNIVGLANSSADGSRKVSSAFVELRTPFTKAFEMDFAGRYDKYPNLSGSFVPKVGAKWEVSDVFTLRSTYARGFRAPALTQVSPGGVQSFSTVVDSLRCPDGVTPKPGADKTDCAKGISSLSSATPDLKPEKSKSHSFGMIIAPTKNVDVLVDWYHIRKENESALLSAQFIIDHPDLYPGRAVRDTNVANQLTDAAGKPIAGTGPISQVNRAYVNQGATDTSGIDFEVTMRTSLGEYGKLTSKLSWSYLLTYKRAEQPGDAENNVAGDNGGIADWATSGPDMPRNRANASITWSRGDHALTGTVNFVSSVSLLRRFDNAVTYPAPYCYYGTGQPSTAYQLGGLPKFNYYEDTSKCEVNSWTTFGVNYGFTGIKNLTLSLNIQNLLNTKAPYDPRYPTTGFNTQLHNGEGRYFRGTARYAF